MDTSEDIMLSVFGPSTRQRVKDIVGRLVEYVREKYPKWQDCPEADLRAWLVWHWCHGLVAPMQDLMTGKLVALVVVRMFDEPTDGDTAYFHKPGGRICYVDLALSDAPPALAAAITSIQLRHGVPVFAMRERPNRGLGPKIYLWKKFAAHLAPLYVKS